MSRIASSQTRAIAQAWDVVAPAVLAQRHPADRVLGAFLKQHHEFGGRDRRLIGDSVHGLLRWWGWVGPHVPDVVDPLSPAWARVLLAVALLEGETAPSRAAIEAYWVRQSGRPDLNLTHWRAMPDAAARAAKVFGGAVEDFPLAGLIPAWAVRGMESPRPLSELITWLQHRPPLWLRVQWGDVAGALADLGAAGLGPIAHPHLTTALRLTSARVNLQAVAAYRAGRVEVQDVSSQAVAAVCGARMGERWWDVCAGAGGKTLALAFAVGADGHVCATDVRADALEELARRAQRAGLGNVSTAEASADGAAPEANFDGVLVDAPCSGSGTWRRSPWARWQLQPDDVAHHVARQQALLAQSARAVRPGGLLCYATCSLFHAENGAVVAQFLAAHAEFRAEPFAHPLTGQPTAGILQLWPWDADGDAMFVARLRRNA